MAKEELHYSREQRGDLATSISLKDLICLSQQLPQQIPLISVIIPQISSSSLLVTSAVQGKGTGWDECPLGTHLCQVPHHQRIREKQRSSSIHPCWSTILQKNPAPMARVSLSRVYFHALIKNKIQFKKQEPHRGTPSHVSHNAQGDKENLGPPSADHRSTHVLRHV